MAPNSRKKTYELPPALQTRPRNKEWVVGAPDMPNPRRTHEEVVQEQTQKAAAQARADVQRDAAMKRALDIEALSAENAPTISQATANTSSPLDSTRVLRSRTRPTAVSARANDSESSANVPMEVCDPSVCDALQEEHDVQPVEESTPSSGNEFELDDRAGGDENNESSSMSGMEADSEDDGHKGSQKVNKGKGKAKSVDKGRTPGAVGKRKHASTGMGESEPTPRHDKKKAKASRTQLALIPGWETVLRGPLAEDAPTQVSKNPYTVLQPTSRSSRSSTGAASIPPSSSGDTSNDNHNFTHGFADDNELDKSYPQDMEETHPKDLRAALRYRERKADSDAERGPQFEQQARTNIMHATTKVITRTFTTKTGAKHGGTTSTARSATTSSASTVALRHNDTAAARVEVDGLADPTEPSSRVRGKKASRPKLEDIPSPLRKLFTDRFVPLTRQYLGTQPPWTDISLRELQTIYERAFGTLADANPLAEGDKCFKLIQSRINDWRSNFSLAAIAKLREILGDLEEQSPETFRSEENKGQYAQYLLGDGNKAAPFYWAEWNEGVKKVGRLQGDIILGAFTSHLEEVGNLPASDRTQEHASGALVMSVIAALHALTHFQTGDWRPPKGRKGWFVYENYCDTMVADADGKPKIDKRLSRVVKVVNDLSDAEWHDIHTVTRTLINDRNAAEAKAGRQRRGKRNSKKSGTGGGVATGEDGGGLDNVDGQASDDSDVMLVADA